MKAFPLRWHVLMIVFLCGVVVFQLKQMNDYQEHDYRGIHTLFEHEIRLDAESELNMMMLLNHHIYHYDELTQTLSDLQTGSKKIERMLADMPELTEDINALGASVSIQTNAINAFKANLGIYLNSERYLSLLIKKLSKNYPERTLYFKNLSQLVYEYLLESDKDGLLIEIQQTLQQEHLIGLHELKQHINIMINYSQRIRENINTAMSCGTPENIHLLSHQFDERYGHDIQKQRQSSYILMALVLALLVYLSLLIWRISNLLKQQAVSHAQLSETKADLEEKVRDLLNVEERFNHLFDVIPDAVVVHQNGICLFTNPAAVMIYGYSNMEPMVGKSVLEHIHEDDRETVVRRMQQLQEQGKAKLLLEKHLRKDGSMFFAEVQGVSFEEEGEQVWVVLIRDVTERLQKETERKELESAMEHTQRLESLGVLAGGIAHDFNNLLTVILGNVGLLKRNVPDQGSASKHAKYTTRIMHASQRAADLCQQMLAYSGQGKLIVQPTQLSLLIQEIAELVHVSMKKTINICYQLDEQLPLVQTDQAQMQQIIMNLVINANESMTSGEIVCSTGVQHLDKHALQMMMCEPDVESGDFVFIEVKDQGCGMDAETLTKIFEPFFTTKFTGRGLGMSAVLGIVRGHHGALDAQSELGVGTVFRLFLPVDENIKQTAPITSVNLADDCACPANATVLVVDDEDVVREVEGAMLEDLGVKVVYAENGIQALDVYKERGQEIDLVLLDMTMPKMDGKACFEALVALNHDVKVVISSGYHPSEIESKFSGHSLAGFVQKPCAFEQFEAVILPLLPKDC